MVVLACAELPDALRAAALSGPLVPPAGPLVVDLATSTRAGSAAHDPSLAVGLRAYPGVTVGVCRGAEPPAGGPVHEAFDVLLTDGAALGGGWVRTDVERDLDVVTAAVRATPIAARVLVGVLRYADRRGVAEGLLAESTAYSTLQGGPEFAAWLEDAAGRARQPAALAAEDPLVVTTSGSTLHIELNRPQVRNAFDASMRERLVDVLSAARLDPTVTGVRLSGRGPVFCAGGDLTEFGSAVDPARAHLVRIDRSPARLLDELASRTVVRVHGACIGAGIELPAFAGTVLADHDTEFGLPELAMGLIPGAGGTVSLTRRVGRQRTAYLALAGRRIDARTALSWGLVDAIADRDADSGYTP
jgi:enoyl-CoA hydratase/carnithine racemase